MIHDSETLDSLFGGKNAELVHGDTHYKIALETRPSCSQNCPAGINVKGYINLIANRRYEEALEIIRESNPFPGICGRVCTHPCEANCQRSENGEGLSIKALKRFVSDHEVSRKPADFAPIPHTREEKVAIIGSGPAGLTAAVDLTRLGYEVTVFEATDTPGGMMMWGIPEFRLPRLVLRREVSFIESMGVDIRTDTRITQPRTLFDQGFGAVILATGSWKGFQLRIPGEELAGVVDGLAFLRQIYAKTITELSGHVVVIGGGDSAIDAARTALRLGAEKVTIAYRRTENEMPASDAEIREAKEEGVEILTLAVPKRITGTSSVEGIELLKAELGDEDDSGRRRPIPIIGSEYLLPCDLIIPSIGAVARTDDLEGSGITFTAWNTIEVKSDTSTPDRGIFAIGDAVRGPSTIVEVIGDAHLCAASVHSFFRDDAEHSPTITAGRRFGLVVRTEISKSGTRNPIPVLDPHTRSECFDEVEEGYSELVARTEASRCNTCGPCAECPTCLPNCDSKQVVLDIDSSEFLLKVPCDLSREIYQTPPSPSSPADTQMDYEIILESDPSKKVDLHSLTPMINRDLCIACGRCESACAYRAVRVGLKRGGTAYSFIDHDVCRSCGRCVLVCPSGAITLQQYSDKRLFSDMEASIQANDGIAVFSCHWSQNDDKVNDVELMCLVGITPSIIIQAFALGARGVLIAHCSSGRDHYLPVDYDVGSIAQSTMDVLLRAGIKKERVWIRSSGDLSTNISHFRSNLDDIELGPFNKLEEDNVPGRIGRANRQLTSLSHQTANGSPVNQTVLTGNLLRASGMPHPLGMIESIRKISEILGLDLDPETIDDAFIAPSSTMTEDDAILHELILENLKDAYLHPLSVRIGIHASCAPNDKRFASAITDLVSRIPEAIPVLLEQTGCGGNDWRYLDSYAREKALAVYRSAQELGADVIVPTSPDCFTHLQACNRPGSWRHSSLEVKDIYTILLDALTGGEQHG